MFVGNAYFQAGRRAPLGGSKPRDSASEIERVVSMTTQPGDNEAAVLADPGFCTPKECLADSVDAPRRHRSTPVEFRLQEDVFNTRLVARVSEFVVEPQKLFLELDVFTDDSDEPHHEVGLSLSDLLGTSRFCLGAVADALAAEAQPMEYTVTEKAA
ncbi:hypothetical protein JCM9534A_41770 [Catenuloplanes indicus JCM 9534]